MSDINFSNFDLSHVHKTSMDMGKLVPIACIPTLPGDKFKVDVSAFVRGMPTIAPIMDKVDIKINHFYVPYRILWEPFGDFISRSQRWKVRDANPPTMPTFDTHSIRKMFGGAFNKYRKTKGSPFEKFGEEYYSKYQLGKLCNYLGLRGITNTDFAKDDSYKDLISMMPLLAYNKIFLDYYVPQRWVNYLMENDNGHWLLVLSGMMENIKHLNNIVYSAANFKPEITEKDLLRLYGYDTYDSSSFDDVNMCFFSLKNVFWNHDYYSSALPEPTIFGDVKLPCNVPTYNADGNLQVEHEHTVRDLRKAISLQHYFETLGKGGGRYLETMQLMFNKRLPDDMLQFSEYLGGSTIPLFVNEVEQTSPYESSSGQKSYLGDLSGKPVGAGDTENIHFEADEYGIYMCLAHIVPKRSYYFANNRPWRELDVMEFPNPLFEGIGDQAVYGYEVGRFIDGEAHNVWGYVPRYAHYKTGLDRFSGEMQGNLSHWHLGDFILRNNSGITPEAIECKPRTDIFQVPGEPDKMLCTFNIGVNAVRPLSHNPPLGVGRV